MYQHERTIRPALAGLIIICFLMPFVKVSCGGQQIASISGMDLVMGSRPGVSKMLSDPNSQGFNRHYQEVLNTPDGQRFAKPYEVDTTDTAGISFVDGHPDTSAAAASNSQSEPTYPSADAATSKPEPFTAAALILIVVALLTSFGTNRKMTTISAICAACSALSLFIFKSRFSGDIPPEAAQIIAVEWAPAFWIALIGAGCLAGYTAKMLAESRDEQSRPRLVIQSYTDSQSFSPRPR